MSRVQIFLPTELLLDFCFCDTVTSEYCDLNTSRRIATHALARKFLQLYQGYPGS